ncbi:MAG TPA: FAD-dependent oxidoreductase, partial [Chromatiales bacterium]|nr:FAD-dependent oxidoreductase [Chromatiales bacterium]
MSARDLVIIGGGAGGLVVASVAAQLGLAVTLVERSQRLGGDCLHHGCVPSKAL